MTNEVTKVQIELTAEEFNYIQSLLQKRPYEEVQAFIANLNTQVERFLNFKKAKETKGKTKDINEATK